MLNQGLQVVKKAKEIDLNFVSQLNPNTCVRARMGCLKPKFGFCAFFLCIGQNEMGLDQARTIPMLVSRGITSHMN